ncbi:hypothetical protein GCM10011517_28750 [Actibacterium pelagium]|uniref:Uncharacterized protein n=1 Tax=Actibacterium pelagium TaxID=2029103 RepID=A0A917AL51_9RHOB|nr:hypothetical protein GCM10011517_28750 [Actibacterium pelagium]
MDDRTWPTARGGDEILCSWETSEGYLFRLIKGPIQKLAGEVPVNFRTFHEEVRVLFVTNSAQVVRGKSALYFPST